MRWLWIMVAACYVPPPDGAIFRPRIGTMNCQVEPFGLMCRAWNFDRRANHVCGMPYLGVKATGALYMPPELPCSQGLGSGERTQWVEPLPIDTVKTCGRLFGGCEVVVFALDADQPDVSPIVDYARELEARAPWAGSVQPTVDECRSFLLQRSRDPSFPPSDASPSQVLDCITHPRSTFECLRAAPDVAAANACP